MAKAPVKQEGGALAVQSDAGVPDYLKGHQGGSGLQGLDAGDFIVPRIKLLQGTSTEPETFDEAKVGTFWVNVLDVPIGDSFEFTPILNRKRVMLMPPMGSSGTGIYARANDGMTWNTTGEWELKLKGQRTSVKWAITDLNVRKSGLLEYGTSDPENPDSPPAATLFYDFLVMIHGDQGVNMPVLLSLARSAAKVARNLQMKIEAMKHTPMWARKFIAKPFKDHNNDGQEFWNWQFAASGFVPEEVFARTSAQRTRFMEMNFRGAEDDLDEAATAAPSGEREF